jgi:hypothetical protein
MKALATLGIAVSFIVALVLGSIFNGYALSVLWGWFVVPVFHLPVLTVVPAIGIAMVVGYLTHQTEPDVEEKERETGEKLLRLIALVFFRPAFALFFGWIVHQFM